MQFDEHESMSVKPIYSMVDVQYIKVLMQHTQAVQCCIRYCMIVLQKSQLHMYTQFTAIVLQVK